jgi:hypothetical protein
MRQSLRPAGTCTPDQRKAPAFISRISACRRFLELHSPGNNLRIRVAATELPFSSLRPRIA